MSNVRRGVIKVMNRRGGAVIQEELNGVIRIFKQPDWDKELRKRDKMTEEKWNAYAGLTDDEEEDTEPKKPTPKKTGAAKPKKGASNPQKSVVKKNKGATLIQDDDEHDPDEKKA